MQKLSHLFESSQLAWKVNKVTCQLMVIDNAIVINVLQGSLQASISPMHHSILSAQQQQQPRCKTGRMNSLHILQSHAKFPYYHSSIIISMLLLDICGCFQSLFYSLQFVN